MTSDLKPSLPAAGAGAGETPLTDRPEEAARLKSAARNEAPRSPKKLHVLTAPGPRVRGQQAWGGLSAPVDLATSRSADHWLLAWRARCGVDDL
jgi:hypothetical protein